MTDNTPRYVLGHADLELERLKLQASIIGGITWRLLRDAGVSPGMRVLDIGCGAGDVSLLATKIVGPSGHVTGIDREARAIGTARERAAEAGLRNVEFQLADDGAIPGSGFDAAVGRYVLVHQREPAELVSRAAQAVKPGGIVAFHELALTAPDNFRCWPVAPLFDAAAAAVTETMRATLLCPNFAARMIPTFKAAGLAGPRAFMETIVGDALSPLPLWLTLTYRVLLPHAEKLGLAPQSLGDPETLAERMTAELKAADAQVASRPQACIWARRGTL